MVLLNSSIFFLISQRRSKFRSSGERGHGWSLLLRLSPSFSRLPLDRFSSCCSRSFISWFCLVSSSTVAASAWICWAKAAESWLDSIEVVNNYFVESRYRMFPQTAPNWWSVTSSIKWYGLKGIQPPALIPVWLRELLLVLTITGVVLATTLPMPKSKQDYGISMELSRMHNCLFLSQVLYFAYPFMAVRRVLYTLPWVLAVVV